MKRLFVDMAQLASWDNLTLALWRASRGKRHRPDVARFLASTDQHLGQLQQQLLQLQLPLDHYRRFRIRDPKPRNIVAVSFELRVVHHAIMNLIGKSFEKSQIHNSFACLPGRGVHAAIKPVQKGLRRSNWYVAIDIEKYFDNIEHERLKKKLRRRFKGNQFLALLDGIIDSYQVKPGRGLPIGSLTSQYFANFYLERCDRFIQQLPETSGYVRYMDDMIWFCNSKQQAKSSLERVTALLEEEAQKVKPGWQIQPCKHGVHYCGFRILPHSILLSRRKKRNYRKHLLRWQHAWNAGDISALELQQGYDAVHALTYPARALGFRRSVLARSESVDV